MSLNFTGFVLRSPKSAPSNSIETSAVENGVVRDFKPLPAGVYSTPAPDVVDIDGWQYKTSTLDNPQNIGEEYLVWAANSSNLSLEEDPAWTMDQAQLSIPSGNVTVNDTASPDSGQRTDGSNSIILSDTGQRDISDLFSFTFIKGDDGTETTLTKGVDFEFTNISSGLITLLDTPSNATTFDVPSGSLPAASSLRGDQFTNISYTLAEQKFWWTKNDTYKTRFGWKEKTQRWERFFGSSPKNLGVLQENTNVELSPKPDSLNIGDFLPGTTTGDEYAMVRLGPTPDSSSIPVGKNTGPSGFDGILVVSDQSAEDTFNFNAVTPLEPSAVIGVNSGVVQWNPAFVDENIGQTIWYIFNQFEEKSNGVVGNLIDTLENPLFISPIPEPTDRPFISLGSRTPLTPVLYDTEADLPGSVPEGSVAIALTTGRLLFSSDDVDKSDPDSSNFDIKFLDTKVLYKGVALNFQPQPIKESVNLVDTGGNPALVTSGNRLFIPNASKFLNLGTSGILHVPDNTGAEPSSGTPTIRPDETGLVREIESVGDLLIYSKLNAFKNIEIVDDISEAPEFNFQIPQGTIYIERKFSIVGSEIKIGTEDRNLLLGESLYFRQGHFKPSLYLNKPRIFSRNKEPFQFSTVSTLILAVDGVSVAWVSPTGDLDAETVASSLQTALDGAGAPGTVSAYQGKVLIASDDDVGGSVEIGFGDPVDNSAAAILGFLPGWYVEPSLDRNWISDSGSTIGMYRTGVNLTREEKTPDFKSFDVLEEEILTDSIIESPLVPLNDPPLRDKAGFAEDVFFRIEEGFSKRDLINFEEVYYEFQNNRFSWIDQTNLSKRIQSPISSINFENTQIIGSSLIPEVSGGLEVSEDGNSFSFLEKDQDYLLPDNGFPGVANLIEKFGSSLLFGFKGTFSSGGDVFTDPDVSFSSVNVGDKLEINTGDSRGYYIVKDSSSSDIEVTPNFPTSSGSSLISWTIYDGENFNVVDEAIIADVVYEEFNHFPEEPFQIRLLLSTGFVPSSVSAQSSNRNTADLADAILKEREVVMRFGLNGEEASLIGLNKSILGEISNSSLFVPGVGSDRFSDEAFSIQVGNTIFSHGGTNPLNAVISFSPTIPSGEIEYLTSTGEIAFAEDVLSDFELSEVYYVEEFISPSFLDRDEVEFNPFTGELNFSENAIALYGGVVEAYFVEQMITENREDVALSPLNGSIQFTFPLKEGHIVEVEYFRADNEGNILLDEDGNPVQVLEFLPNFIRGEEASRVNENIYSFNASNRTVVTEIEPDIYRGADLQNFGGLNQVSVNFSNSNIEFVSNLDSSENVTISYAVLESSAGARAFTVSSFPVYRKPFFLEAEQNTFILNTDRTGDLITGKLLRLGNFPTYIESATYDSSSDTTEVKIFPAPIVEAGSRAPANDVISLITGTPITSFFKSGGGGGGSAIGGGSVLFDPEEGFMVELNTLFDPIPKGSLEAKFFGDFTSVTTVGSVLEIEGYPFIITDITFSEETQKSTVSFSYPTPRTFTVADNAKVSVRPIYPPNAREFIGVNPVIPTEEFELVLFGETNSSGDELPGRVLTRDIHYQIDFNTGNIQLLEPNQEPLRGGQTLYLRYTTQKNLAPILSENTIIFPRYRAGFSHVITPSETNGLVGKILKAKYTYESPDSFYFRTVPLNQFLGEVVEDITQAVENQNPHGGSIRTSLDLPENYERGTTGPLSDLQNLEDQDRVGRSFISFYNDVIVSFEQVLENIDGINIGDRSGKFRFFVGKDRFVAPPGYEDIFTGELNNRNIWSLIFQEESSEGSGPFTFLTSDNVVEPLTASLSSDVLSGRFPSSDRLEALIERQALLIKNDIDDIVLIGTERPTPVLISFFRINLEAKGIFALMGDPHIFSRLFPEQATSFSTTFPGVGSDLDEGEEGVYTYGRVIDSERQSTFQNVIGTISNPVVGVIENITFLSPFERLPAARVVQYSPSGFPEFDAILGTNFTGNPRPALLASMVPLKDFPLDSTTGIPDISQLRSQGGTIDDLLTGDIDLSRPPWEEFVSGQDPSQIGFGSPDGTFFDVGYSGNPLSIFGQSSLPGIYVDEIFGGCVLTFREASGSITNPNQIVVLEGGSSTGTSLSLNKGDTIRVIPRTGIETPVSDPPTQSDISTLAKNLPNYRLGFDLGASFRSGEYFDTTYPSQEDPSFLPIKEIFGQKPPEPLSTIEAFVRFSNSRIQPLQIPALLGEDKNDSGDDSLPYLSSSVTEKTALRETFTKILPILTTDSPVPNAVYPDEILDNEASVVTNPVVPGPAGADFPATILSTQDLTPVATAGSYVANSGIGDIRRFDLVLVQLDDGVTPDINKGSQGFLSVGEFSSSQIEPPRFVSPSRIGDRIRYTFDNVMVHVPGTGASGFEIEEIGSSTFLTLTGVSDLVFNDGIGASPTGGLNNIVDGASLPFPNANEIRIKIYNIGGPAQVITISATSVSAGLGSVPLATPVLFNDTTIEIPAITFFDFSFHGGSSPGPIGPFDFTIDVDTYVSSISLSGSYGGGIAEDRLTFKEDYDLRNVGERGLTTTGGFSAEGQLNVINITGPTSEDITVNENSEVNGGDPFTFLRRPNPVPEEIGTFTAGTGGTIKMMAMEGYGNTAITSSEFTFSAIPSSDYDESGIICQGVAEASHENPAPALGITFYDNKILGVDHGSLTGSLSNVESGDVLVIEEASDPAVPSFPGATASTKVGTYLVKHSVESDDTSTHPEYREVSLNTQAGIESDTRWLRIEFPTVVSFNSTSNELTISDTISVPSSPTGHSFASPGGGRRIYVVIDSANEDVVSAEYSLISGNIFTLSSYEDENGASILSSDFEDKIKEGDKVSGMVYFKIKVGGEEGLPENNTVGYDLGGITTQGFRTISLTGDAGSYVWSTPSLATGQDILNLNFFALSTDEVGVEYPLPSSPTSFINNEDETYFHVVSNFFDFSEVTSTIWSAIRTNTNAECILPGDDFNTVFYAEAGIYLEPSFPRTIFDLSDTDANLVDASHTLLTSEVGFRDATSFGLLSAIETVSFSVRRIRRFHEIQNEPQEVLEDLSYIYKIRRGEIDTITSLPDNYSRITTATSASATNLGPFNGEKININPGDFFRVVDSSGSLLEEAEISAVEGGDSLLLSPPGLTLASPGSLFEIFIKNSPVPHEQSNKELLELLTQEVLYDSNANYATQEGGFVDSFNELKDTAVDGVSLTFGEGGLGVEVGDYILIDPAGELEGPGGPLDPPEKGSKPIGDASTSTRSIFTGWEGEPSTFDDNRGYYKISEVQDDILVIAEATTFAGVAEDGTDDVFFAEGSPEEYVIYPTINGSSLNVSGREGQQSLRPTAYAGTGVGADPDSFEGNSFSVAPFSYRVIRPSTLFSEKATDLILMHRERILSWLETLDAVISGEKSGTYFVFQRDEHAQDLGNVSVTGSGLGLFSNEVLTDILGLYSISPFANSEDGLSILDRRFWILDRNLDFENPPFVGGSSYSDFSSGTGRPVLPDYIDGVLDREDQFRELRYSWISYRTNRRDGTLLQIKNFENELPQQIEERQRLNNLKKNN